MVKKIIMVFVALAFVLPAVVHSQGQKTVIIPKARVIKIKPVSPQRQVMEIKPVSPQRQVMEIKPVPSQLVEFRELRCKRVTILCNCYWAGADEWRSYLFEGIRVEHIGSGSTCRSFAEINNVVSNPYGAVYLCHGLLGDNTANRCVIEWDCACDGRC